MQLVFKMLVSELKYPQGDGNREVILVPGDINAGILSPIVFQADEKLSQLLYVGLELAVSFEWGEPGDVTVFVSGMNVASSVEDTDESASKGEEE
jgi:hypothetical protein